MNDILILIFKLLSVCSCVENSVFIMKVNLIKTENIIEYRNFYFAEVSKIEYNGKLFGYFYSDKSNKKEWFVLFYDMKLENEIILPQNCHFGEDCIYCHGINEVNQLCEIISKFSISDNFDKIKYDYENN